MIFQNLNKLHMTDRGTLLEYANISWRNNERDEAELLFLVGYIRFFNFVDLQNHNIFLKTLLTKICNDCSAIYAEDFYNRCSHIILPQAHIFLECMRYNRQKFDHLIELISNEIIDTADRRSKTMVPVLKQMMSSGLSDKADKLFRVINEKTNFHSETANFDFEMHSISADLDLLSGSIDEARFKYATLAERGPRFRGLAGLAAVAIDQGELKNAAKYCSALRECSKDVHYVDTFARYIEHRQAESEGNNDERSVDIVIFAHATEKMKFNAHLAPPCTDMIEAIVERYGNEIKSDFKGDVIVMYDHRDTKLSEEYLHNLIHWSSIKEEVRLVVNKNHGLRKQWLDAFDRSNSQFVFVIEQDHAFHKNSPKISELLMKFHMRRDINYIRLNRRPNMVAGFDCSAFQGAIDIESQVTRTGLYSNTPHIIRRKFYDSVIKKIINGNSTSDGTNDGAGGVEESLNRIINLAEQEVGTPILLRFLGFSIWGNLNDPAIVTDLGM